ncbi:MAG TPA: alpha/beta hydrolase, partial [Acidimicrobiales bacterium]
GASDSVSGATLPEYERWADDARAVLDASGSEQAAIYGASDSGPIAILFAAVEPERTQALILGNATARFVIEDDYPSGLTKADIDGAVQVLEEIWGTDAFGQFGFPDASRDPAFGQWFAKMSRLACTPRRASSYFRWVQSTDVRKVLPSIRVPTLILHRKEVSYVTLNQGRYLAEHIPGARLVVLPGADIGLFTEPTAQGLRAVEEFLKTLPSTTPDRALAAVLLTEGTQTVFAGHRCHPGFLAAG